MTTTVRPSERVDHSCSPGRLPVLTTLAMAAGFGLLSAGPAAAGVLHHKKQVVLVSPSSGRYSRLDDHDEDVVVVRRVRRYVTPSGQSEARPSPQQAGDRPTNERPQAVAPEKTAPRPLASTQAPPRAATPSAQSYERYEELVEEEPPVRVVRRVRVVTEVPAEACEVRTVRVAPVERVIVVREAKKSCGLFGR